MSNNEWLQISQQLHDELNVIKRDALVPYVIEKTDGVENERDLYEQLLIDVEMGSCGKTSKVGEAIAAAQLYFHRYFINLEDITSASPDATKHTLKTYWQWMKNYRVWEANRQVFLYPENYIRPELRDTKTPVFKALEDDLMQGEITEEAAQRVYQKYLDEYTEVSRLTIAGGYVYDSVDMSNNAAKSLVLFGRTKTDPRRYYYRMAQFLGSGKATTWEPWLKVETQIEADKVYPVFAFNRVFVFWVKIDTIIENPKSTVLTTTDTPSDGAGKSQTIDSTPQSATHVLRIFYSFYNLNKEWVPAQTFRPKDDQAEKIEIKLPVGTAINDIKNIGLLVETSTKLSIPGSAIDGDHENIIVQCTYTVPANPPAYKTFSLTPELYAIELTNQPPFGDISTDIFKAIFDEPSIPTEMVTLNTIRQSSEGSWFSFDHKGGSFLCKPDVGLLAPDQWPKQISTNTDGLPRWTLIDAAVQLPNRKAFFFKNDNNNAERSQPQTYVASVAAFPGDLSTEKPNIQDHWGQVDNNIARTGIVNAAYVDRTNWKTYLFSGNQYVAYTHHGGSQSYDWVDEGYPQPLVDHPSFPGRDQGWTTIDAVFQGKDQNIYFFNNTTKTYLVSGSSTERSLRDDWGTVTKSSFIKDFRPPSDDAGAPSVDAGFVVGSGASATTYLMNRSQYIKYTGTEYRLIEGEPKGHDFLELLIELGFHPRGKSAAEKTALRNERVVAAYNQGDALYFYTKSNKNYTYRNGQLSLDEANKTSWSAGFELDGIVYQFNDTNLTATNSTTNTREEATLAQNINAAFAGADDQVYLFWQLEYIAVPKQNLSVQSLVAAIAAWTASPREERLSSEETWGKMGDNIARNGTIDTAFCDGEKTYLFSGDEYVVYSGEAYGSHPEGYPDAGYPKPLTSNPDNFPQWDPQWDSMVPILQTFTAAGSRGPIYYFDNVAQTYQLQANPSVPETVAGGSTPVKWGKVDNNIVAEGIVDAAFVKGDASGTYLFLTRGDQVFRYTIDPARQNSSPTLDATLSNFVDRGYPKKITWDRSRIDAAFTLAGKTYVFAGDLYFRLGDLRNGELQELTMPPHFKPIRRNWGNLPQELTGGLDGAFEVPGDGDEQDLYLFRGDRYIKYTIEDEHSTQPFELAEVRYEIVRLTTSVAYRLNQELFAGGLPKLLSLATQEIDDTPSFSRDRNNIPDDKIATTIRVNPDKVSATKLPISDHLDFASANGMYYWEIFFHAPFLIAQSLNLGQQFEGAKRWYEYIYDPTGVASYWRFLPFETDQPPIDRVDEALINTYLTDPFDPHAIAALRPMAYRKAIVMAYLDNLIDWGDMLFQQYTRESINEARMLYILAYDLLGPKPENLGRKILSEEQDYAQLKSVDIQRSEQPINQQTGQSNENRPGGQTPIHLTLKNLKDGDQDYDFLVYPTDTLAGTTPHASVTNPYFFVPENTVLLEYWNRVEDRLYKIRHCLNIMGISQPLPLFEPPIDPMALVRAVSSGAGLSSALASLNVPVPHYRFDFMLRKAQSLADKLSQFGNDLLSALEKKDAEELSLLQNRQEGIILNLTRSIKQAQVEESKYSRQALEESLVSTTYQRDHYDGLLTNGLTALEIAQIALMTYASYLMVGSGVVKVAAAIARVIPKVTLGPFSLGTTVGGDEIGEAIDKGAEAMETLGDGISMVGEAIGIFAQHERSKQDWTLQKAMAESEIKQINLQIQGAVLQEQVAQRELEILEQQIAQNESISTFMKEKFTNAQLYQWMASKLSGLYYQTYQMAFDMAKAAEKSFQFERGIKESEASFINGPYWDSQRKGLLAGNSLGLDLDRMEKAYIDSNRRGFEITKAISLLDLDPVALLRLKTKGVCEFSLPESLFDYDFPGHYCRQIRTLSLAFDFGDAAQTVMATLTQLNHKTVLEPDAKAVKYLLDPKDQPPLSLRNGWKASQQIALSHVEEGEKNNGLFELRFDDERYLPFENTGAVSTWRLELNGKKGSYDINALRDVVINLKYTAEQGGQAFASAVKGLLKPYPTARLIDVAQEFPEEWAAFLQEDDDDLVLPISRELFPNMSSSKIAGIFVSYDLAAPGNVSMVLNRDKNLTLKQGKFLQTTGLSISSRGSDWTFTVNGDKEIINNIGLVLSYKASV